jgi:lysophospholipase L1-like esterase
MVGCEAPILDVQDGGSGPGKDATILVLDGGAWADAEPVADAESHLDAGGPHDAERPSIDAHVVMDSGAPPGPDPIDRLDDVTLYLNLGDSFGAGYNADSGRGYAALVCDNHAAYPSYAGHDVVSSFPGADCRNKAESGATSADVRSQSAVLPASAGDTIVTIYVGGNDFNDEVSTMLSASATMAAIEAWEANLAIVLDRLEARYSNPSAGQELVVLIATIHDPTDGMGTIPPQYEDGFCGLLQNPIFTPGLRQNALQNLASFNDAIRAFATARGAIVVDTNQLFIGHGMNAAGADKWLADDCAHGNNTGHHEVRREIWRLLTGDSY